MKQVGDLSPSEIDRICHDFKVIARRYGLEMASRLNYVRQPRERKRRDGMASQIIMGALGHAPQTVYQLAADLRWQASQVHGVLIWLRKQHKVSVHSWRTSAKGRRIAVYQVAR